jgi:hypothetical protein
MTAAQQLQEAHSLLDTLPEEKVAVAYDLLETLAEPSYTLENAPFEDEELTPETMAVLERAEAALARGESVSHDEVLREFGLKH